MLVLQTDRLVLRRLCPDDAAFCLELLNEPGWIRYIGDKGVRNLEDAHGYLRSGPLKMYETHGFGLFLTVRKADGEPLGLCGLLKRDTLPDVDVGYGFLERHGGQGYAFEAARAVVAYGRETLGLGRIVAITLPSNAPSIKLLGKLGLRFERRIQLSDSGTEVELHATV